jgi:hypothetical protein
MDSFPLAGRRVCYRKTVIADQGLYEVGRAVGSNATVAQEAAFNFSAADFKLRSADNDTGVADNIVGYFTLGCGSSCTCRA